MNETGSSVAFAEAVAQIWRDRALDDQAVQMPGAQDAYRDALGLIPGHDWDTLLRGIRTALASAPHAVVVRGNGADQAPALLAAVAVGMGEMMNPYRDLVPGSPVIQEIVAKGPQSPDQVWNWHTDSANWPVPNDLSALACVRAAPSGGSTQILSLDSVRASPHWNDKVLAPLWESDFRWPMDGFLGGGTFVDRCVTPARLRFRRELMTSGTAAQRRAADAFATIADTTEADLSALLRPGDVVVFDNSRAMHRAGPVVDPGRRRLLLRTKIRRTD